MISTHPTVQELLKAKDLPPCPSVIATIMTALQKPDTTVTELAQLIAADSSMTVKLLQLVNSAYYGLSRTIRSVDEAAFRLGFGELWAIAVAAQMSDTYQHVDLVWDGDMDSLWHHSLKTALLARSLSASVRSGVPEEMFTAGILHDIGKMVLICHDREGYQKIVKEGFRHGPKLSRKEREIWGVGHAELGGALLRKWGIPEQLARAVERHHDSDPGGADLSNTILSAADALVHAMRFEKPERPPIALEVAEDSEEPEPQDAAAQEAAQAEPEAAPETEPVQEPEPEPEPELILRLDFTEGLMTKKMVEALDLSQVKCVQLATECMRDFEKMVKAFR